MLTFACKKDFAVVESLIKVDLTWQHVQHSEESSVVLWIPLVDHGTVLMDFWKALCFLKQKRGEVGICFGKETAIFSSPLSLKTNKKNPKLKYQLKFRFLIRLAI